MLDFHLISIDTNITPRIEQTTEIPAVTCLLIIIKTLHPGKRIPIRRATNPTSQTRGQRPRQHNPLARLHRSHSMLDVALQHAGRPRALHEMPLDPAQTAPQRHPRESPPGREHTANAVSVRVVFETERPFRAALDASPYVFRAKLEPNRQE